ncbi:MAG: type II toxin-antitoxin system mRNA interferase toxin, RelE/StbE family [Arcobacter sp.]|nr:MAG: type II toxin-antitoxin system mRNA interferase toxin, RelE/StbE family [Arcobacter sp.]
MTIKTDSNFSKSFNKIRLTKHELGKFITCMINLVKNESLPAYAKDHFLLGKLKGYKEFHLSGDKVVIYKTNGLALQLVNIGSHTQVFRSM